MKFHRIKPTSSALLDPYNHRMVAVHEEEGFVTNEVQANHLISMELATLLEANVDGPGGPAPAAEPVKRAGKKKIDEELV